MIENFDTIIQQREINTNPVVRETKIDFKNFPDEQGLHALFLEKYEIKENQPFVIERVPENTDRSTSDKKNYYCIDVKQVPKNSTKSDAKIQAWRGFIVQNSRQSVFYSATKSQGFLMLSKSKTQKNLQLRPFLCGSIIKKRVDDPYTLKDEQRFKEDPTKRNDDPKELNEINDKMKKAVKQRGKQPIELFMRNPELIKNTRNKKEESEYYEDDDYQKGRQQDKEIKRKKRQQLEDYEDGEVDNEDVFNLNEKEEEDFDE